jgi:hypothetical protein
MLLLLPLLLLALILVRATGSPVGRLALPHRRA